MAEDSIKNSGTKKTNDDSTNGKSNKETKKKTMKTTKKMNTKRIKEDVKMTPEEKKILEKLQSKNSSSNNFSKVDSSNNPNNAVDFNKMVQLISRSDVKNDIKGKIWAAFWALLLISFFSYLIISSLNLKFGNVALIPIHGEIVYSGNGASAKDILSWLNDAEKNRGIKAVLLDINSPGGSADASYLIMKKVQEVSKKKPVIAIIHEIGTSGAYWVASASNKIFANDLSITGSIGVYASYLSFNGLLKRYNVSYERIVAGKYKDVGSPFANLTEDERAMLMHKINFTYNFFVDSVAKNRNLSVSYVKKLATGEFYIGENAKKLKLIDELGTMSDVKKYLKSLINSSIEFVNYEPKQTFLDKLEELSQSFSLTLGNAIGSSFAKQFKQDGMRT